MCCVPPPPPPEFSFFAFTISESINICDAEHGFSSVFFSCARVSTLCEWRLEIKPAAIT